MVVLLLVDVRSEGEVVGHGMLRRGSGPGSEGRPPTDGRRNGDGRANWDVSFFSHPIRLVGLS